MLSSCTFQPIRYAHGLPAQGFCFAGLNLTEFYESLGLLVLFPDDKNPYQPENDTLLRRNNAHPSVCSTPPNHPVFLPDLPRTAEESPAQHLHSNPKNTLV